LQLEIHAVEQITSPNGKQLCFLQLAAQQSLEFVAQPV
jgi:hypothetical protein